MSLARFWRAFGISGEVWTPQPRGGLNTPNPGGFEHPNPPSVRHCSHSRSNHILRTSATFIRTDTPLCSSFLKLLPREFVLFLTSFLSACWKISLYFLLAKLLSYRSSLFSLSVCFDLDIPRDRQTCMQLAAGNYTSPLFSFSTAAPFAECMFTAGPSDDKRTNIAQCYLPTTPCIALYDNILSNSAVPPTRLSILLII